MSKTGYIYILTNKNKTVLYVGVTNSLQRRLSEHVDNPRGFVLRFGVNYLVYYETVFGMGIAISREKQIKGYSRAKKEALINENNPDWRFMNDEILKG